MNCDIESFLQKAHNLFDRISTETGSILLPLDYQDDDTEHTIRAELIKKSKLLKKEAAEILSRQLQFK